MENAGKNGVSAGEIKKMTDDFDDLIYEIHEFACEICERHYDEKDGVREHIEHKHTKKQIKEFREYLQKKKNGR